MTDDEFDRFVAVAVSELSEKQTRLTAQYRLGEYARWHFDQEKEQLDFFDSQGRKAVQADVIDIGSYASSSNTWKWGWANESVLPNLRKRAEPLKALAALTGMSLFAQQGTVSVESESMAWELAAMSAKHLDALGVYKAPSLSRPLTTFLAITRIQRIEP